jgi:hypothetical protein
VLDVTRLEFCDACGLQALIGAAKEVTASAGRLVVIAPVRGSVARLFALTDAAELLPLRPTVEAGLGAISPRPAHPDRKRIVLGCASFSGLPIKRPERHSPQLLSLITTMLLGAWSLLDVT